MRTCVTRLNQFNEIAEDLKNKYHDGIRLTSNVKLREQLDKLKKSTSLLYLENNESFCNLTVGRRCTDINHCATYCCGRGFIPKKNEIKTKCKFRVLYNTTVKHEICYEDIYICK